MAISVNLSPDPSNKPDENYIPSDVGVIADSGSDGEGDVISYEGYEVLPQDFNDSAYVEADDCESENDSSSDENDGNLGESNIRVPPSFDQSTSLEVFKLWNSSSSNRAVEIVMDSTKEELIKNAMAGFKLPSSSIPAWAAQIPEEEWKEQLKNRVAVLNKTTAV